MGKHQPYKDDDISSDRYCEECGNTMDIEVTAGVINWVCTVCGAKIRIR